MIINYVCNDPPLEWSGEIDWVYTLATGVTGTGESVSKPRDVSQHGTKMKISGTLDFPVEATGAVRESNFRVYGEQGSSYVIDFTTGNLTQQFDDLKIPATPYELICDVELVPPEFMNGCPVAERGTLIESALNRPVNGKWRGWSGSVKWCITSTTAQDLKCTFARIVIHKRT